MSVSIPKKSDKNLKVPSYFLSQTVYYFKIFYPREINSRLLNMIHGKCACGLILLKLNTLYTISHSIEQNKKDFHFNHSLQNTYYTKNMGAMPAFCKEL
jgi:hypothetical protein